MSAGTASEVDAAGCALPPEPCSFSTALPEETPMPWAPSPTPLPAAMLVTTGMLPLLYIDDDALGSREMLVMSDELVLRLLEGCGVWGGPSLGEVREPGKVLVTVGEVLLMEAASGAMLVMGGWGRVELGWGAVLGAPLAAMSLRPCSRDEGTLILPAASLCSACQQQHVCKRCEMA